VERGKMEQRVQIDLGKIEREFSCPSCGEIFSHDEESCVTYDILAEDNTIS